MRLPLDLVTVIAGGPEPASAERLPDLGFVIAADGGAASALSWGVVPDLIVGDFDSLQPAVVRRLEASGSRVERYPVDKDETDFELALDAAFSRRPRRLVALGSSSGRLDHVFAQLTVLAARIPEGVEVDANFGSARAHVVRGRRLLVGERGELVSLFAVGGDAAGVRTAGLRFPLSGETLYAGSGRGVSNVFERETVEIAVEQGVVLVIRPGSL
jgi:thiamine pyrophosphokinase